MIVDVSKIDKLVSDLVSDYDRRDGYLPITHVERLLEKRQLSVEECSEVYRQLEQLGINPEDESEPDESSIYTTDNTEHPEKEFEPNLEDSHIDTRLRLFGVKLLTADEEVELGRRMELGRRAATELEEGEVRTEEHSKLINNATSAKETMINANLRLVLHIARPYIGFSDLTLDDLFQEGVMGLIRATEKFDHKLGYKFSTYATWWIRQSITRALADRGATIRLPVHVHDSVLRLKRAYKLLNQAHPERRASIGEISDELAWPIEKVHFIQQISSMVPASLDEKLNGHDDLTLMDSLVSELPVPEEEFNHLEMGRCLERVLEDLPDREKEILRMRFGLNEQGECSTLEEIGKIFGVTRERIRQIEAVALKKLRHPIRASALQGFLE